MADKRLFMPAWMAQYVMKFTQDGQQCRNVFHAIFTDTEGAPAGPIDADVLQFGIDLRNAYVAYFMPLTAHDVSLDGVDFVRSFAPGVGPLLEGSDGVSTYPVNGGESVSSSANNVSLAIKLSTKFGGRSFHGRFYFIGINKGLYDDASPNRLKAGSVSDFATAAANFAGDLTGRVTFTDPVGNLGVGSFVHNGSNKNPATVEAVTSIGLTDSIFDSQRRRLPGRGT